MLPPMKRIMHCIARFKTRKCVPRNELKTARIFARVRLFKSGRVLFLEKTGTGLKIRRQTGKLTKCVTDYQVKDIDSDGQSELVVAVTDPNKIMGEKKSLVMVYNLK